MIRSHFQLMPRPQAPKCLQTHVYEQDVVPCEDDLELCWHGQDVVSCEEDWELCQDGKGAQ